MGEVGQQQHQEREWAAFAAIDWADRKHFWKWISADSQEQQQGELQNSPEAIDQWATGLNERFGGRPIAVCLEQSRGALVCQLAKYQHLVLFPVHPKTAAQYRETFCPSGAKSDGGDTASLLDLLLRHRHQLRMQQPDTPETRLLQILVEDRRKLVDDKTRAKNQLTATLKLYFPQLLQWCGAVDSPLMAALLQKWGTLPQLQKAHPGTLRRFFLQHNCRGEELIRERIAAIQRAVPATEDEAMVEGESRRARALVEVMATLRTHIAEYDKRIAEVVASHPDAPIFASFPGAGPALMPRLLVAFGTNRERFQSAEEVQRLSGIAPVTERSGHSEWVHMRWACPHFMRQTFHEFAAHSIGQSEWAKAFYDREKQNQKQHHAIIRALAYKWQRILFRCWKELRPYDEQTYLRSLQRRNSPVIGAFALTTGCEWKLAAGFQKLFQKSS